MGFALCMPSTDGFRSQGTFLHVFGAVEEVVGGGDGDASFQWVEATDLFEFLTKDLAGCFREEYIGFAVGQEFCLEIEDIVVIMILIPGVKLSSSVSQHRFWISVPCQVRDRHSSDWLGC